MRTSAILTVLLLAVSACHDDPRPKVEAVPHDEAEEILESTPWLDSAPRSERDVINAYVFQDGEGLYFVGNSFKATYELFKYRLSDDAKIKLRFLDEDKAYDTKYAIERYRGEIFDYKLTLKKSPRGPKVYYGFDAGSGHEMPAVVSKIKTLAGTP